MTKHRKSRRSKKNILSRGYSSVKNASRKIIPGVATGIESVGKDVVGTAKGVIPKAQGTIRSWFSMFSLTGKKSKGRKGSKGRKRRSRRTRRKR